MKIFGLPLPPAPCVLWPTAAAPIARLQCSPEDQRAVVVVHVEAIAFAIVTGDLRVLRNLDLLIRHRESLKYIGKVVGELSLAFWFPYMLLQFITFPASSPRENRRG